MAGANSRFTLAPATEKDLEEIGPLFFRSFHEIEYFRTMQPETPEGRQAWVAATRFAINDPYTITLKVTDNASGRIVSHGRWIRPRKDDDEHQPGEEEERWADLTPTCDEETANALFGAFARNREEMMGHQKHYYMELLMTVKEFMGQGAGSLIVQHGCDLADDDQLPCYIDASPRGKRLYEKFGFVFTKTEDLPLGYHYNFGIRQPKQRS